MATRNISLTAEQDAFVAKLVASGEYQNASEAMRDALRALKLRREEDAARLKALRTELDRGIADLDAGNYVTVKASELASYLKGRGRRRAR
jgi:antitoxin ParD1/3/4